MKRKYWIVISFIWIISCAVLALYRAYPYICRQEFTPRNHSCAVGSDVYVTETVKDRGFLYCLDPSGRVLKMADTDAVDKKAAYRAVISDEESSGLYCVIGSGREIDGAWRDVCRIARYDSELNVIACSDAFLFEETGRLTGFSCDADRFYLTTVSETGDRAYVYVLKKELCLPLTAEGGEEDGGEVINRISCSQMTESGYDRFFADARYQGGVLYTMLDDGTGADRFAVSDEARTRYENRVLSFRQCLMLAREPVSRCAILFAAVLVLAFLAALVLKNKNRIVYVMFTMELMIVVLIVAGCAVVAHGKKAAAEEGRDRFCSYYLANILQENGINALAASDENWYGTDEYAALKKSIFRYMQMESVRDYFEDICVVRTSDGVIVASGSGRNLRPLREEYTKKAQELADSLVDGRNAVQGTIDLSHLSYPVFGVSASQSLDPRYVLIGIASPDLQVDYWDVICWGIILFFLCSIVFTVYMIWQVNDLRKLENAMQDVAGGHAELEHTRLLGNDMKHMWNTLYETDKTIKDINYKRFKAFEAYYRFAPKDIEEILQKESIMEVEPGDSMEIAGNMAVIRVKYHEKDEKAVMDQRNRFIAHIERCRKERNGILISADGSLSVIELLFPEETGRPFAFGMDFMHELHTEGIDAIVMLVHSQFRYGVAGTDEQCFTYTESEENSRVLIDETSAWLRTMGLQFVVTEDILRGEQGEHQVRYLGYINIPGKEPVKLYEVLDACPNEERRDKIKYLDAFHSALELFYQKDFYLARSQFTEILRAMPQDGITKWYIFTCEKYLNESYDENVSLGLNG